MNGVAVQVAVVALLLVFSLCGVPQRRKADDSPAPVKPAVSLLSKVSPVADALAGADEIDRALWAAVWERAAVVAEGDIGVGEPVIVNTKELRAFTVSMLQIAWQRLRKLPPGAFPRLDAAVEEFLSDPEVLGRDDVLLTDIYRAQYARAMRALAYAGRNRG